jgi:hypothetical protein
MNEVIEGITGGLTIKERGQVLRWLSSLPEDEFITIFQKSFNKYHSLKSSHDHLPRKILQYCGLIVAGREHGWDTIKGKGYRVAGQDQYDDWSRTRELRIANLAKDRSSPKKRQVLSPGEVVDSSRGTSIQAKALYSLENTEKSTSQLPILHLMWRVLK